MVGCVRMASRSVECGTLASIAVCTTVIPIGLGADHRETENAVVVTDQGFHKPFALVGRVRALHHADRQARDARRHAFALGVPLGHADAPQQSRDGVNCGLPAHSLLMLISPILLN